MENANKYVRRGYIIWFVTFLFVINLWIRPYCSILYKPRPIALANTSSRGSSNITGIACTTTATSTNQTTCTSATTSTSSTSTVTTSTSTVTSTTTISSTSLSTITSVVTTSSEEKNIEEVISYNEDVCTECLDSSPDDAILYSPGEYPEGYTFTSGYVRGDANYILLCNCLGLEYGSDSVIVTEKAKVIEVILNRVASAEYPDTVYGVISQPYQFSDCYEYLYLETYSDRVTCSVQSAVDWYLEEGWYSSNHGYLSFYGDGTLNYFY